jgi:hypothetical protein
MTTADDIFKAAFDKPRTPRSEPYRRGVLACLMAHEQHGTDDLHTHFALAHVPTYPSGSAEFDAFWAGVDEGHALWRTYRQ